MATDINSLIHQEAAHYGVPDWVAFPLVQAESNDDPNAVNPQSGATGLLQLMPSIYGKGGANLRDPKTNLDLGFAVLGGEYRKEGKPGESLNNFIKVISSSGWPGTGGPSQFSQQPANVQFRYVKAFDDYGLNPPSVSSGNPGQPGPVAATGTAIHNLTGFSALGWLQGQGWKFYIVIIAILLLIVTGAHIVGNVAESAPTPVAGAAGAVNELSKKVSRAATSRTVGHAPVRRTRGGQESGFRGLKR